MPANRYGMPTALTGNSSRPNPRTGQRNTPALTGGFNRAQLGAMSDGGSIWDRMGERWGSVAERLRDVAERMRRERDRRLAPPMSDDPRVDEAGRGELRSLLMRRGRRSTVLAARQPGTALTAGTQRAIGS